MDRRRPFRDRRIKAVGSYLYAIATNLSRIEIGGNGTVPNWKQVSSTGLPIGAAVYPEAVFQGQLYAQVRNTSGTFDLYRTRDIGKMAMAWTKVVDAGFGNPFNHELRALVEYGNRLIAITSNTRTDPTMSFADYNYYGPGIQVWESSNGDLGSWSQVNQDGFGTEATIQDPTGPKVIRTNQDFGSSAVYGGYLYIGTLAHWHSGQIWRYNGKGLSGWTDVTPKGMCAFSSFGCSGPSRASEMVVYNGLLYLAQGVSSANLETFDGTTWTIVVGTENPNDVTNGHPFDPANIGISSLAVLPYGDKLFALTMTGKGGIQVWGYPFSQLPLTCEALSLATTITLIPFWAALGWLGFFVAFILAGRDPEILPWARIASLISVISGAIGGFIGLHAFPITDFSFSEFLPTLSGAFFGGLLIAFIYKGLRARPAEG